MKEAVWIERINSGNRSQSGKRHTLGHIKRLPLLRINDGQAVVRLDSGALITVPRSHVYLIPEQMQEAAERIWNYFRPGEPLPTGHNEDTP